MGTKIEFIDGAYSRMRISGITKIPSPGDIDVALRRLENMAATWAGSNNCTNYNFEDQPDPGSDHNVDRKYWSAYESNLAMKLLADFGKDPHPALVQEARGTKSALESGTAIVTSVAYPRRQAVGSGNELRGRRWGRFYTLQESAPNECATVQMLVGEINIFTEHFDSVLLGIETVSSYTIASSAQTKLTLSNDSLTSPDVTYTAEAVEIGVYHVTIKATTSLGRVFIRKINFVVTEG